jgi:hypothetical protein
MKKFLLIASDIRSFLDLKNIAKELAYKNIPYFFLYNLNPDKYYPHLSLGTYSYDSNVDLTGEGHLYQTLGFNLPFKPDVLIITNENWEPEKTILWEFKQKGTFIACVENSSWIHNNIKTKLELTSRRSFPSNCIDVFFDHSEWCKETKQLAGFSPLKSIVTGNPKYDDFDFSDITEEDIMIVYGSMEKEHHYKLFSIYRSIKHNFPEYEVYYKPHPNEVKEFPKDFYKEDLIKSQEEYLKLLKASKFNIGLFTSVMYLPLVMDKNIVYINQTTSGIDEELNINYFKGHEFEFWSKILDFKTFKEFEDFISKDFILDTIKRNKNLEKSINTNLIEYSSDMEWVNKKSNNSSLKHYYDKFNDQQASIRIIDYLIK